MGNTGKKIVITLKEVYTPSGTATGQTKSNVPSDPDYIPPSTDLTTCPITYATTCPVVALTAFEGAMEYEFSLSNAVVNNPAIKKMRIRLLDAGFEVTFDDIIFPVSSNFFDGVFSAASGVYDFSIQYLDASDSPIASCDALGSVTIT